MRPHFFQLALTLPEEIRLPRRVAGLPLWLDACGWTPSGSQQQAAASCFADLKRLDRTKQGKTVHERLL